MKLAVVVDSKTGNTRQAADWIVRGMNQVEDIGILHRMILQKIPYEVEIRSLKEPSYREIGLAMRSTKSTSAAVKNSSNI